MRLWWHPFSVFPRRVRIAVREKGLACEEVVVDLPGGATRGPEFRMLNPFGQVPVLEDDGLVLAGSVPILEYLEERWPEPALLPSDLRERARARVWVAASGDYLAPAFKRWLARLFAPPERRDREDEERARLEIAAHLDVLEAALAGREWLADRYSLAEVAYAPFVTELPAARLADVVETRPAAAGWIARIAARPAARSTAFDAGAGS
jgi:glutathione S-transferase